MVGICVTKVMRLNEISSKRSDAFKLIIPSGLEEMREELTRLALLNDIAKAISSTIDLERIFDLVLARLHRIVDFDCATISLVDFSSNHLVVHALSEKKPLTLPIGTSIPLESTSVKDVFRTRMPLLSNDLQTEAQADMPEDLRALIANGMRSRLVVPLVSKGTEKVLGCLSISCDKSYAFEENEIGTLTEIAERLSFAISNGQMFRESERKRRELAGLFEISQIFSTVHDIHEIYGKLTRLVAGLIGAEICVVASLDPETKAVYIELPGYGITDEQAELIRDHFLRYGHLSNLAQTGDPIYWNDADSAPEFIRYVSERLGIRSALAAPMKTKGQVIGAIYCANHPRGFTEDDLTLLMIFASQAAEAMTTAALFRQTEAQARREALLNRITTAVRQSLDIEKVAHAAVEELGKNFDLDRCYLLKISNDFDEALVIHQYHTPETVALPDKIDLKIWGPLIERLKAGEVLVFNDVMADPLFEPEQRDFFKSIGTCSVVYIPVIEDGQLLAVIGAAQCRYTRKWLPDEVSFFKAVTDQVAIGISQAQMLQRIKAQAERESLLNRISSAARHSTELDVVLEKAVRELGEALDASLCCIMLLAGQRDTVVVTHQYHRLDINLPIGRTVRLPDILLDTFFHEAQPLLIEDIESDVELKSHLGALCQRQIRSMLSAPLISAGEPIGILNIQQAEQARKWTQEEIDIVKAVADQIASTIRQMRLFQQVVRSKEEWEATFDAMADAIFIFNAGGKVVRSNAAAARLVCAQPKPGLGPQDGAEQDCITLEEALVRQAIATGERISLCKEYSRLNRFLDITIDPILGQNGEVVGAVEVARDLTELKRAEEEVREHQAFAADLMANAYDGIATLDGNGNFTWVNKQMLDASGYEESEIIGRNFLTMVVGEDFEKAALSFEVALRGEPQLFETRCLHKDGHIRTLLITYTPFRRDGAIQGVLLISRDITQQKMLQESAARSDKLRALGELASGVAHDFNNVLAVILARAQLLQTQVSDERLKRNLDVIARAAIDGSNTIKRIQNYARLRNDHNFTLIDLNQLILDTVDMTRTHWKDNAELAGKKIKLETDLTGEIAIEGDPSELREVLINLIINAVDAMPSGGKIQIKTEQRGDKAIITLSDTGEGIPEEIKNRIFDPFFTTKGAKGTGLGLSVSYGIISRHNGQIAVESKLGCGATFTITLPIKDRVIEQEDKVDVKRSGLARILIIDDEESVREVLADILDLEGHRITCAEDGPTGLKLIKENEFDLVLTDLGMPGMNGWEVARSIKKIRPYLPVTLSTGWGVEIDPEITRENGVDFVLNKPFKIDDVLNVIADALEMAGRQGR